MSGMISQGEKYRLILEIKKVGRELVRKAGNPIKFTVERSHFKEDNDGKN